VRNEVKGALIAGVVGLSTLAGVLARETKTVEPRAVGEPQVGVEVIATPRSATPTPRAPGFVALRDEPPPASLLPPPEAKRPATVDVFYAALAPFGEWILIEGYGRCWRPRLALSAEWHPYAEGHWVATDLGWAWVSDNEWGERRAAPYHYGGWARDGRAGWFWVPDVVWAPSRVTWRTSDDWIGWAPTPPPYRWAGSADAERAPDVEAFVFVPAGRFLEPRPWAWHAAPAERSAVYGRARPVVETVSVDGVAVNVGPPVARVTVVTGVGVSPVKLGPALAARGAEGHGGAPGHASPGEGHGGAPGGGPAGPGSGPTSGSGHGGHGGGHGGR
jgi:hypothetical protein